MNDVMGRWEPSVCPHPQRLNPNDVNELKRAAAQNLERRRPGALPRKQQFPMKPQVSGTVVWQTVLLKPCLWRVKQSTGCLHNLNCQYNLSWEANTRGCCCARLHDGLKSFNMSGGFKRNEEESAVCSCWTEFNINTFALALQTNWWTQLLMASDSIIMDSCRAERCQRRVSSSSEGKACRLTGGLDMKWAVGK